jgi:hypothetical protein
LEASDADGGKDRRLCVWDHSEQVCLVLSVSGDHRALGNALWRVMPVLRPVTSSVAMIPRERTEERSRCAVPAWNVLRGLSARTCALGVIWFVIGFFVGYQPSELYPKDTGVGTGSLYRQPTIAKFGC